jgi:hypothetical protein
MLKRLIDFGIFSILFFSSIVIFKSQLAFEFYINYVPLIILLLIFIFKFRFPTQIFYIFVPLLTFGLINIFFENDTFSDFLKIYLNIFIGVLFFYYVFEYYDRDIEKFFSIYMNFCVIACIICVIQLISFNVGFQYGFDYRYLGFNKWGLADGGFFGLRVNGFFSEPSYVASTIGPAFFISIYNLFFRTSYFINRNKSILIALTYLLTFSSVAYLGILFVVILLLINYGIVRYLIFAVPAIFIIFYYLYNNVDEFKSRIDGVSALYIEGILENEGTNQSQGGAMQQISHKINILGKIHGSSFVQYNNFVVAKENFVRNPLFGSGLGSHGIAFEKYNLNSFMGNEYKNNSSDANSMLLRIVSETGLYGIIFMFLFIKNYYVKKDTDNEISDYHWLISNAVLIIILLQLARQGNYTYGGFMAYMWLYYYTKEDYLKKTEEYHLQKEQAEIENMAIKPLNQTNLL